MSAITNVIKEKRLIFTLAAIQFVHILDFMVIMPLGPQLMRVFHINAQQFSLLIAVYTLSAGLAGFSGAFFLDTLDRKKALIIMLTGFFLGTLCCALSSSYIHLLFSRIITGSFGGISSTLVLSILGDTIPEDRRGRAMGAVMMSFSFASIFGVPIGLFLATAYTWSAPFYLLVGLCLLIFLLIPVSIPTLTAHIRSDSDTSEKPKLIHSIHAPKQRAALALTLAIMLGQFSIIPLLSTYMVKNVGVLELQLPYLYILGGIAALITAPLSGRLGDKYGKFPVFMFFSCCLLIPIFGITHLGLQSLVIPLILTTCLFSFSSGRMVCGMALILSAASPKSRGSFMSINTAIQQLGAGIASYLAGCIVTQGPLGQLHHYSVVGYWAMAMALLSIFIASRIKTT
jgi:predicted MFS family arabinose efflux permease